MLPYREHQALAEHRAQESTPEWRARYRRRAGVEGTISQTLHRTRIRRSRYRGQHKTHLGDCLAAVAIDLIRIDAWAQGCHRATTRTTHLARLKAKSPEPALTDSIMKVWKVLCDCRLRGAGSAEAMAGIARLHNLTLAG